MKIKLSDLYIGKIDAKHELSLVDNSDSDDFVSTYLVPDSVIVQDFLNLNQYYVLGLKGSGKTALLRYIAAGLDEDENTDSHFILFKSDFTQGDRKEFSKAGRATVVDKSLEDFSGDDYTPVWRWFIYQQIVQLSEQNGKHYFYYNIAWDRFKTCIKAPQTEKQSTGIKRLLPKLKRGNVEISAGIEAISGKLGLEFDWEDSYKTKVKFEKLVKQADNLYNNLSPGKDKLFLFFDELELVFEQKKQYELDVKLIRDLVIAINELNLKTKSNLYTINIIAAIRSEVINSIYSSGKEINKIVFDFGSSIKWNQKLDSNIHHPLIQIIIKKLIFSEKKLNIYEGEKDKEIWDKYFPDMISRSESIEYVLHQTWYRPRDIVRILRLGQKQFPYFQNFNQKVFDDIRQEYSKESWIEHIEELRTNYTPKEIDGVKRLLYGINSSFDYNYITIKAEEKRKFYPDLDNLLNKKSLADILSDLYRSGIIGNAGKRVRFASRGDNDIILEKPMKIHNGLWNFLATEED